MVKLLSKISKGTKMDQIYIPKERIPGFEIGSAVLIEPAIQRAKIKPYFYSVHNLEPMKNIIIEEVFNYLDGIENVVITGSFLEKGFEFNDVDVVLLTEKKLDTNSIKKHLDDTFGLNFQIIVIDFKSFLKGVNTDPLFQMMISKFVSKKRVIFKTKNLINYKMLDLHLLNSESLLYSFDIITGNEKYKMIRNLFAIKLFMNNKKLSTDSINSNIDRYFGSDTVKEIKNNTIDKNFLTLYKKLYKELFKKIMVGIRHGSKQK